MKPIDFRNETFADLQDRLHGLRIVVWNAWKQHGPCTTRQLSEAAGLDILSVRPRTTELYQLGLLKVEGEGYEGTYSALTDAEVLEMFAAGKREIAEQTTMNLSSREDRCTACGRLVTDWVDPERTLCSDCDPLNTDR